jgi:nuclear transport factor 2 (NTF2) superfamily protein
MWFRAFGNDSWTWATENLESCKQSLMGNSGGSSDQKADSNVGSKYYAHEVSDGTEEGLFRELD